MPLFFNSIVLFQIKTRYYLDAVQHESDDQLTETLHSFYSLVCSSPIGRRHVVRTIATEMHIATLLTILNRERKIQLTQLSLSTASDVPSSKIDSPIIGYVVDLLDATIRHCDRMDYLLDHGTELMNLAKSASPFDAALLTQLQEMAVYLKPLDLPNNPMAYDDILPLCELVRQSIDFLCTFPGDLITAIRMIRHLAIDPFDVCATGPAGCSTAATSSVAAVMVTGGGNAPAEGHAQLKYKFVVLQLYSADGIHLMATILDKLTAHFEQPGLHRAVLATQQGVLVTQILLPVVQVLRRMISYVIASRGTNYKDLTPVSELLRTYALLYHIPATNAVSAADARTAQLEIVEILLAYTQPTPVDGVDTESVHKSLWSQMVAEVLRFILTGPHSYMAGLSALSELLPVPLPVYSMVPLLDSEITRLNTERQMWSAHLHPSCTALADIVQAFCTSGLRQLLSALTRVCRQLADLAPNMALVVTKAVVELILVAPPIDATTSGSAVANNTAELTARLLEWLSNLAVQPSIRVALVSLMPGKLTETLCGLLQASTTSSSSSSKVRMATYGLIDVLMQPEMGWPTVDYSSYPPKETLPSLVAAAVDGFVNIIPVSVDDVDNVEVLAAVKMMQTFSKNE